MTRCPKETKLLLYATGELPDGPRRNVQAHLAACAACRAAAEGLARGLGALETLDRNPSLRPQAAARIERRLREAVASAPPARPLILRPDRWVGWVAAAAAVLIAVMALWPDSPSDRLTTIEDPDEALREIAVALDLLDSPAGWATTPPPSILQDDQTLDEIKIRLDQIGADEPAQS